MSGRLVNAAALVGLLLAGCTVERDWRLYPTDAAAGSPVLEGHMVGHGNLHGVADLTMPDGELLHGDYTIVAGGAASIFALGNEGHGTAVLRGASGLTVQCDFSNNNSLGHGYGTCRSSKGAVYKLIY